MSCLFPEEQGWGRTPTIGWSLGKGHSAASVKWHKIVVLIKNGTIIY